MRILYLLSYYINLQYFCTCPVTLNEVYDIFKHHGIDETITLELH